MDCDIEDEVAISKGNALIPDGLIYAWCILQMTRYMMRMSQLVHIYLQGKQQVNHHHSVQLHNTKFILFTDLLGRKKAIQEYLDKLKLSVENTDDPDTLDRILALLMKADASVSTCVDSSLQKFEKKDTFAPRQKNETQLRFVKTTSNPGRKQKNIPLRYSTCTHVNTLIHG